MATTAEHWNPPQGTHSVAVGPALQYALDSTDSSVPVPQKEYYSFRCEASRVILSCLPNSYRSVDNFTPDSLDTTRRSTITLEEGNPDIISMKAHSTQVR